MVIEHVALWSTDVSVGDTSASATVVVIATVLLALSVGLAVLAVWLWKVTAVDNRSLAVLEQMSSRRYREANSDERAILRTAAIPMTPDDAAPSEEVPSEE